MLSQHDHARYASAARREVTSAVSPGMAISFIPQHGPYADLTSVLNGADYLAAGDGLYVVFADNLYQGASPLPLLRDTAPGHVTVLASRYDPRLAASRGILITSQDPGHPPKRRVGGLVEKPEPAQAAELEERHGTGNLLMFEGRARLTAGFLEFARARQQAARPEGTEPKLALAIGAYARSGRPSEPPAMVTGPAPWPSHSDGVRQPLRRESAPIEYAWPTFQPLGGIARRAFGQGKRAERRAPGSDSGLGGTVAILAFLALPVASITGLVRGL